MKEFERQYQWSKKGETYKTKYFAALGQLFGDLKDEKTKKLTLSNESNGSGRADSIHCLAE